MSGERRRDMSWTKVLVFVLLILCFVGLSVVTEAIDKPKPGIWKGKPGLSFTVTSEGKITDLVYTVVPGMMGRSDCRVILSNIPINKNKVDYKQWITDKGEAAFHLIGTFTSATTFVGSCKSKWCTVGQSLEGVGMIGDIQTSLEARHESVQEKKE
jgi:hypothetical protein